MTDKSFNKYASMSDKALAAYIGAFIKHQRMELNKTQEQLALAAGISRSTLSLLERGETVTLSTLIQVLRVLDQLPLLSVFEVKESLSPLVLAKMQKAKRQRVKHQKNRAGGGNEETKETKDKSDW